MDWLADILKNLALSKTLVAAVFVTSLVMYWGPIVAPKYVPELQAELKPYAFAVMVLTGCLLALWGAAAIWSASQRSLRSTARALAGSSLSEAENGFIFALAKNPTRSLNLEDIDYSSGLYTKLELHQLSKRLQNKGLVRINDWDDNLVSLTELGRERALEIQQKVRRGDAA
jgi:hypothetical protein